MIYFSTLHGSNSHFVPHSILSCSMFYYPDQEDHSVTPEATLKAMFRGKATKFMPSHVQSAYIQNGMKLFSNIVTTHLQQDEIEKAQELGNVLEEALNGLLSSSDLEVQERASVMQQFIKYIIKHIQKGKFNI